jgi:hypothetical protein
MYNAKEEFIGFIGSLTVIAVDITYCPDYDTSINIRLKANHTQADYEHFLNQLDFEYDDGYGTQHLFGNIWFLEDCWAERYEYDGSEDWEMHSRPEIPDYLK